MNCERNPPLLGDPRRPAHGHRVTAAAQVRGHLLAPLERAVARPGPRRRVVRGGELAAPHVEPAVLLHQRQLLLGGERDTVLHGELVERAGQRAFHGGAVVPPDVDDQGVIELAHVLDGVEHPSHVPVGVLRVTGVDLHLAGVQRLLVVRQRLPGRERVVARRQLGVGRDDPELLLAGEDLLAHGVPAAVEPALVLGRPFRGHLVGGVAATGGEVHEPGLVRVLGAHPVQPFDGLVGHVVGEVVGLAVLALRGYPHGGVVHGDHGIPLARLPAQETPEVLETPAPGPAVQRTSRPLLAVRGQVPLPERRSGIAVLLEDLRERRGRFRDERVVSRKAAGELADLTEARRRGGCGRSARRPGSANTGR